MKLNLAEILIWYVVFLFSTTCHEAAHSWAALKGGDTTAYEGGQVSLDPFPHIRRSPFGMVLVPLVSLFLNGWAIGWASAPFDRHWASRYPRRQAAMSAAGPGANFLLAGLGILLAHILVAAGVLVPTGLGVAAAGGQAGAQSFVGAIAMAVEVLVFLNLILGVFNLIPFPPLDGGGVLEGLFPGTLGPVYTFLYEQPIFGLVGLLVAWQLFGSLVFPPLLWIMQVAMP